MKESRRSVGGFRIFSRYARHPGAGDAPALVMVHGFGVSGSYFIPLAECLASRHSVYLPDLPGHGRSDTPAHPLDIEELAQALIDWMNDVGVVRPILVGQSMGAQIAVEAIRRAPQRFSALILIGPTRDTQAALLMHLWRLLQVAPFESLPLYTILLRDYLRMGLRLIDECRAMMRDPVAQKLQQLRLPTLLIRGGRDAIAPKRWIEYLSRITGAAQVIVVPGQGHAVHYSAPAEVAQAIRLFAQRTCRAKSNNRDAADPGRAAGQR